MLLQSRSIAACKCISKLYRSRPKSASPNSLDPVLKVHLQTGSSTATKCIFKLAQSRPPSASPKSLNHGRKVHLSIHSIMDYKYIVNERRPVDGDTGVKVVDWATGSTYSGDPGVDRHHLMFIWSGSTQLRGFSRPGSIISSHFLPRLLQLEPPITPDYHLWPDWPYVYI